MGPISRPSGIAKPLPPRVHALHSRIGKERYGYRSARDGFGACLCGIQREGGENMRRFAALAAALLVSTVSAIAATAGERASAIYVSGRVPIIHPSKTLSAIRAPGLSPRQVTPPGTDINTW